MSRTADGYLRQLHAVYPALSVADAHLAEGGRENDILIVNDHLIVRFPRSVRGIQRLSTELTVLEAIRRQMPVAIPDPRFVSLTSGAVGRVFMGYPRIPGVPLWPEMVHAIGDAETVRRLAHALMEFLRALHATPVLALERHALPLACGLTAPDWRGGWQALADRLTATIGPRLGDRPRQTLESQLETVVRALPDDDAMALIHGDFATGNVLVDPQTSMLTGVIDFGSAGRGDPAYDIATLFAYGEPFVAAGLVAYPEITPALERARGYWRTFPLQDALAALDRDDRAACDSSIARWTHLSTS